MRPLTILAALAALAVGSNSAVIGRDDPYVGDLRTYSGDNCTNGNQGVGTFTMSMTGVCNVYPGPFRSMYAHVIDGWTFLAYPDAECKEDPTVISPTPTGSGTAVCNAYNGEGSWIAYRVVAKTK